MIDTLDDLLTLKKEDEYKLSLKDNDLNKFVFYLKGAGYEPQKRYGAGRISEIKMSLKFKKGKDDKPVVYSIDSQDLDKDKIDEDIMVNTDDKYNRVSEEMFKTTGSLLMKLINRITMRLMLRYWINAGQ